MYLKLSDIKEALAQPGAYLQRSARNNGYRLYPGEQWVTNDKFDRLLADNLIDPIRRDGVTVWVEAPK